MPNALARESSPYLRQHQENPVDWLAWGEEALARARELERPLLLSIGYSSCHWCHVMASESFEDPLTAQLMNEEFVCVKVDREERPDIDALYMQAVQSMTGHGGWPLNVFLTPEQVPFYGGTYFPPEPRHGLPAWTQLLRAIAESWSANSSEIRAGGERLRERLSGGALLTPSAQPLRAESLDEAVAKIGESFDARNGGFGGAPKFPQAPVVEFLLGRALRSRSSGEGACSSMALQTLRAMAAGGIHDHLGGGFHRYAVDHSWTVPHFEKMLYDNALLARAYLHGHALSKDPALLEVCLDTLDWALREMRGPEGAFYSALDADSEHVEGRFYVWDTAELEQVLGADAQAAIDYFGVSEEGNFEDPHHPQPGLNVLQAHGPRPPSEQLERIRTALLAAREQRVRPGLDDKRLTSWNALMIGALARAGAYLSSLSEDQTARERGVCYLDAASRCAEFILGELRQPDGSLNRVHTPQGAKIAGFLEDHAFMLAALLDLYEASFQERWFSAALALADETIERFGDPDHGGFFSTVAEHGLLARRKDLEDSPIPAGASSAALGLLRLAALSGETRYQRWALGVLELEHEIATRHPLSFGHLLQALDFELSPTRQVAIVGDDRGALERVLRARMGPDVVVAATATEQPSGGVVGLLSGRSARDGMPTAYVCEHFSCLAPTSDPLELQAQLR